MAHGWRVRPCRSLTPSHWRSAPTGDRSLTGKWRLAYIGGVGDVYKALADPTRRTILDELTDRDGQTLFELCSRLTMRHGIASSRQAISQHLDVLEDAGLVDRARGPIQVPLPRHHAARTRSPSGGRSPPLGGARP